MSSKSKKPTLKQQLDSANLRISELVSTIEQLKYELEVKDQALLSSQSKQAEPSPLAENSWLVKILNKFGV